MDIELKSKVDVFNDTYKDMRKSFMFDGKRLNMMKTLLSFTNDRGFDIDKVKEVRKYLFNFKIDLYKLKYGKFLSLFFYDSSDYKKLYKSSRNIYEHLIAKGFNKNKTTLSLSLILSKNFEGDKLDKMVDKIVTLREQMGYIDYKYYIILALSDKKISNLEYELKIVQKEIQSVESYNENMSKLIALSVIMGTEDVPTKVENVFALICNIKSEVGKISEESLVFIGIISLIIEDPEVFAKELKNIYFSLNNIRLKRSIINKDSGVIVSLIILMNKYIEEAEAGIIYSRINKEYLKIIQDYVVCLMYFI